MCGPPEEPARESPSWGAIRREPRLQDLLCPRQPARLGEALCFPCSVERGLTDTALRQPPARSLLRASEPRAHCRLAVLGPELKTSVLQVQTILKQCLRKSSQKIHFKDKAKHPDYCSVFCYQHVPPPSTIRVNIYRAAFSTSQLQFTDTNLHT